MLSPRDIAIAWALRPRVRVAAENDVTMCEQREKLGHYLPPLDSQLQVWDRTWARIDRWDSETPSSSSIPPRLTCAAADGRVKDLRMLRIRFCLIRPQLSWGVRRLPAIREGQSMLRSLIVTSALIAGLTASSSAVFLAAASEPFQFKLAPPRTGGNGEELWDATVMPNKVTDSRPPAFQIRLSPHGRAAPDGTTFPGLVRRGDPRGMSFMLVMLGEAFGPGPRAASGQLRPLPIGTSDSIPLVLTTHGPRSSGYWTALATLPNGGQFEIAIDSAARRGEFRSVREADNRSVLVGLAALIAPRP
jgi:hypothetical protein